MIASYTDKQDITLNDSLKITDDQVFRKNKAVRKFDLFTYKYLQFTTYSSEGCFFVTICFENYYKSPVFTPFERKPKFTYEILNKTVKFELKKGIYELFVFISQSQFN